MGVKKRENIVERDQQQVHQIAYYNNNNFIMLCKCEHFYTCSGLFTKT